MSETSDTPPNPYATQPGVAEPKDVVPAPLEAPQSVTFGLTPEMLAAWWTYRTLRSPGDRKARSQSFWRIVRMFVVIGLVLITVIGVTGNWRASMPMGIIWFSVLMFIVVLLLVARRSSAIANTMVRLANRVYEESPEATMFARSTMTIDHDGVHHDGALTRSITSWRAYEKLEVTDDYLYLFQSSISAEIVPRSAFVSRSQYLGFAQLAVSLWESAKKASASTEPQAGA